MCVYIYILFFSSRASYIIPLLAKSVSLCYVLSLSTGPHLQFVTHSDLLFDLGRKDHWRFIIDANMENVESYICSNCGFRYWNLQVYSLRFLSILSLRSLVRLFVTCMSRTFASPEVPYWIAEGSKIYITKA